MILVKCYYMQGKLNVKDRWIEFIFVRLEIKVGWRHALSCRYDLYPVQFRDENIFTYLKWLYLLIN